MSSTSLINPYLQARQLLTLSQQRVADEAMVSVSCVRYNEQGLFLHPIPKLTDYFARLFRREALTKNYYRFQRRMRQKNRKLWLLPEPNIFQEPIRATFKFNGLGVTRFCKLYCCQSVLLYQPKVLIGTDLGHILLASGFTPVQLQELHDRLQEYHDRRNGVADSNADGTEILRDGTGADGRTGFQPFGPERPDSSLDFRQAAGQRIT